MDDLQQWLEERGLESLHALLCRNDVSMDVLFDLSDEDLKELGLTLGQRRRLLKAIGNKDASASESVAQKPQAGALVDRAERRQLTVMFVDLVGSTALSARLDPEEMRHVIRAYQNTVAGEIARFEGHVARFMGDGVLAYFGWPQAHEDEADRAVRTGFAIVRSVSGLPTKSQEALAARVGIATGLVVVGDLVGVGAAQEEAVIGETPNLAARLQGAAEPGQVAISEQTRRLVGSSFVIVDVGPRQLKGLEYPVPMFAVTGEGAAASSRFETRPGLRVGPIVGRDQELALLQERWSGAVVGEGQGVLLTGEAGIGKSRLALALRDALRGQPHVAIRYQCSPYHRDSALWSVVQQLAVAAGFLADDPAAVKLDRLEALLAIGGGSADALPLIASLLGIDATARCGPLELSPQVQRARTLAVLSEQLLGLAAREPVLVVLEDAHWIDPTTLDLIEMGLDRIGSARVMMLLTSRPDGEPPLAAHPHITRLTLNRLSRPAVEAITARVAGVRRLSAQLLAEIASRTDGVPLFVEELTKAVVEMSQSQERRGTAAMSSVGDVPATLHDSLMARLDRVPEVKRVAQLAACIGREFDYRTLLSVADLAAPKLQSALERLSGAELVFRCGKPPDATYTFKHALVRDAAANSLLFSERRRVHAAILGALESADTPRAPELLAQHAEAAGLEETAIERWMSAGAAAAGRYANQEAVSHFERALRLVLGRAEGEARDRKELDMLLALGVPLIAARGYASADVERTYARARTLCQQLGESEPLFFVLRGLWNCVFDRADLAQSLEIAELLLALATRREDPEALALAHRALGTTRLNRGEFEAALDSFRQSMAACRDFGESAGVRTYGEAPYIISWIYSGWVLTILGRLDEGRRTGEAALAAAHRCGNPMIVCFSSEIMCHILIACREPQACVDLAEAGRKLAEEHLLVFWMAGLTNLLGWGLAHTGRLEEGIARMRDGIAAWKATGAALHVPTWNAWLAEILLQAGAVDDAGAAIDESIDTARRNGDVVVLSVLHRLKAEVLRPTGRLAQAEEQLIEARAIAARQRAKLFELQATCDLARLWAERGEHRRARDLLRPAYAAMPDSHDTADVVDARELLASLDA